MESNEGSKIFSTVLSAEEWSQVPSEIAKKLEAFAEEKFEELITSKALYETKKAETGKLYKYFYCFKALLMFGKNMGYALFIRYDYYFLLINTDDGCNVYRKTRLALILIPPIIAIKELVALLISCTVDLISHI